MLQCPVEVLVVLFGQRADRQQRIGQAHALAARKLAPGDDFSRDARGFPLHDAHADLAVVEQQHVPRLDGFEDRRMRKEDALRRARRLRLVEAEDLAVLDHGALALELAEPEFRPLQIGEDADRMPMLGADVAHGARQRSRHLVRRMAHVDAEHVHAGQEQALEHLWRR